MKTEKEKNAERRLSMRRMGDELGAPPPYSSRPPSTAASSSHVGTEDAPTPTAPTTEALDFTPSPLELPTHAECIAHLKLLHAFAKLRHEVGNEEGLFGIEFEQYEDARETIDSPMEKAPRNEKEKSHSVHEATEPAEEGEEARAEAAFAESVREKRWTVFVTKAVDRFEKWWVSVPNRSNTTFTTAVRMEEFDPATTTRTPLHFPVGAHGFREEQIRHRLPPLDILMVWHAYMLNPRTYLEDCMRAPKPSLWRTSFPWKLIYECIDDETFEYTPPVEAKHTFMRSPFIPWDWREDDSLKALTCPRCCSLVMVPYTRPPGPLRYDPGRAVDEYLSGDTGYAGACFNERCHRCGLNMTHEKLRVGKFIHDASEVMLNRLPLPGTILNADGMPGVTARGKGIGTHDAFFPNRVVEALPEFQPADLRRNVDTLTVDTLKTMFQHAMRSKGSLARVNSQQFKSDLLAKDSKIAVRKVLSHYWDNSSAFGLDLVGAVIRQAVFVQKMSKIDWLHSPALVPTMMRLVVKYHRFIRIIGDNPRKTAVPTLDVDLAWHTHQLSPHIYFAYTLAETKRFVNHDDKMAESTLHAAFQWTSAAYEKKYGQPYAECACWYCECTREPLRSSFTNRVNPFRAAVDVKDTHEKGLPRDAVLGPHVSAHSALAVGSAAVTAHERRRELEELDLLYGRVCRRYQKKKREEETPQRDNEAYVYGAYGYPLYYPVYVPYYAEPTCDGDRYSSGAGGGAGACAAGTCSAGASMGSCSGGVGTPGCKASCGGHGDAGGGCGSCGGGDGGGGCGGGCGGG